LTPDLESKLFEIHEEIPRSKSMKAKIQEKIAAAEVSEVSSAQ
jgi:hypothetical protein